MRACPSLCASGLFFLRATIGRALLNSSCASSCASEWAILLALVGPAAAEAWRLKILQKEVRDPVPPGYNNAMPEGSRASGGK